ncbi:hypothetical protein U9M48_017144 [Paspalum notatum var. saurae]|uniref:Uncharacterized protein n=1 Tax=Paspalum notatum var. saurae TaxID=547442 RepID=A0AAQ3WNJ4_PASNO
MEPKKSSAQRHPHAMEPKKSSPRSAGAAAATTETESPLSSLFNPPAPVANGKDQELYNILYKGQSGSAQAGMTDGKPQWAPSKSRTSYTKDNKHSPPYEPVDTSFGSSVNYGGRDYFHGSSTTKQGTGSSKDYKVDKKDPATDSHGDWWQGSFYY